jgi:hypothetical protein
MSLALRYGARAWSLANCLFVLAFVAGGKESLRPTAMQALGLLFFPIGVLAGQIIAWLREVTGALISIGSLVLFFVWIFVRDGRLPGFPIWFLVLTGPAFLFLAAALLRRRAAMQPSPSELV